MLEDNSVSHVQTIKKTTVTANEITSKDCEVSVVARLGLPCLVLLVLLIAYGVRSLRTDKKQLRKFLEFLVLAFLFLLVMFLSLGLTGRAEGIRKPRCSTVYVRKQTHPARIRRVLRVKGEIIQIKRIVDPR